MDFKIVYEFKQKQELNAETDRFYKFLNYVRSFGKAQEPIDQVFLINGMEAQVDDDEYLGMIQTFKKIIKSSVADKIQAVTAKVEDVYTKVEDVKASQEEIKTEVEEIKASQQETRDS